MAPAQTGSSLDNILDLTLSSPEPDERPWPQAQARTQSRMSPQQARLVFERESQSYKMSRVKHEDGQPATSSRIPVAPQQINPEHLREIIRTANPLALEDLLLDLCRMSPAMSHALVRGLAPNSSAAQRMIHQRRGTRSMPVAKQPKNEDDNDDLYELTKKRLAPPKAAPGPSGSHHFSRSCIYEGNSSHLTLPAPHGSQSMPRAKQEMRSMNITSDSDDDLHLPRAYPRTAPRPPPTRTPLENLLSSSAVANRTPNPALLAQRLINAKKPIVPRTMICTQCKDPFEDEDAVCLYHTGKRTRREDGSIIWECCHEDGDFPGCKPGIHTIQEEPEEEAFSQQKRPNALPRPGSVPQKRPRI